MKKIGFIFISLSVLAMILFSSCAEKAAQVKKAKNAPTEIDTDNYRLAIEQYKQGEKEKALSTLDKIENKTAAMCWLQGNIYADLGQRKKAVDSFSRVYDVTKDEALRSKVAMSILSQIDKMSDDDLEEIQDQYKGGQAYVLFELGERYTQQGNNKKAIDKFEKLISLYPQHEYRTQADSYLNRLKNLEKVEPYTIGVVLPLSGKNAPFGMKSLMGIQLAAGVFGGDKKTNIPVKLAVMDSQSNPEVTKTAVNRLIEEDHVAAIIGPLSGDTAEVVARQCSVSGIPNITLSQKDGLEGMGKYVFRTGLTNKSQVKRLVAYAMDKLSIKKFGILYPEDNYGQELSKYFWDEVLRRGGEINAVESYEVDQSDFKDQIKKLLGIYYVGTRLKEYNDLKEQKEAEAEGMKKKKTFEITLPPVRSFDALFIADEAKVAAQIAPYLPFYDAKNIVLMGPNTWNSPQLVLRGGEHVEGAIFVDGFTPDPPTNEGKAFVKDFRSAFNSAPGVLEFQGYDATNIIIDAMKKAGPDERSRDSIRDEIAKLNPSGDGDFNKELFVFEVSKGKIILKD